MWFFPGGAGLDVSGCKNHADKPALAKTLASVSIAHPAGQRFDQGHRIRTLHPYHEYIVGQRCARHRVAQHCQAGHTQPSYD